LLDHARVIYRLVWLRDIDDTPTFPSSLEEEKRKASETGQSNDTSGNTCQGPTIIS